MVASGLPSWKPATQACVAACWVLAPAPEIVPETAGADGEPALPPLLAGGALSLAAPQPATTSMAPVAARPIAAIRAREPCRTVFTCSPPWIGRCDQMAARRRTLGNRDGRIPPGG